MAIKPLSIDSESNFSDLFINNDGNLVYNSFRTISIYDPATYAKVVPSLSTNSPGAALSPDGKILYLTSYWPDPDSVYGIDATLKSGLTPLVRIPIPLHPIPYGHLGKLAIDPSGKFAYATHLGWLEV